MKGIELTAEALNWLWLFLQNSTIGIDWPLAETCWISMDINRDCFVEYNQLTSIVNFPTISEWSDLWIAFFHITNMGNTILFVNIAQRCASMLPIVSFIFFSCSLCSQNIPIQQPAASIGIKHLLSWHFLRDPEQMWSKDQREQISFQMDVATVSLSYVCLHMTGFI